MTATVQPHSTVDPIPNLIEDEIVALTLQLADIDEHEQTKKGKYTADNVPDLELAYISYLGELKVHLQLLEDVKLAHSIANAVSTDADAIVELVRAETLARQDRQTALRMSGRPVDIEPPPPYDESVHGTTIEAGLQRLVLDEDAEENQQNAAGPSEPYVWRQANAFEKLGQQDSECIACGDRFRAVEVTKLECEHVFCGECLRTFIMRGVVEHDLALLPPRCCGQAVSAKILTNVLKEDELEALQEGEVERQTKDKTYCSNAECGKFVSPAHIAASKATCRHCATESCTMCKQAFHEDDCPADPELQATLDLGDELKWRRCYSCRALVSIEYGCNHMRCRCGAQFCYGCGEEWTDPRRCACDFWTAENLERRAEQVVDRAAPNIRPAERQRRIAQVQNQLRNTDECEHTGFRGRRMFERIDGHGYGRFECEMCNARHRQFILRCRGCQLDVCMACRMHRM